MLSRDLLSWAENGIKNTKTNMNFFNYNNFVASCWNFTEISNLPHKYPNLQKQSSGGILWKRCSQKCSKTPGKHLCRILFVDKVAGLQLLRTSFRAPPVTASSVLISTKLPHTHIMLLSKLGLFTQIRLQMLSSFPRLGVILIFFLLSFLIELCSYKRKLLLVIYTNSK